MSISTIIAQNCEFIHNFFTVPKPQRHSRPAAVKRDRLRLPLTMANAPAWATDRRAGAARGIAVEEDHASYICPHRFLSCREFGPPFPAPDRPGVHCPDRKRKKAVWPGGEALAGRPGEEMSNRADLFLLGAFYPPGARSASPCPFPGAGV